MIAHLATRRFRAFAITALLPLLLGSAFAAQVNFGLNPSLGSGNVTFNPSDCFTGPYALTGSASLLLSANYTRPAGTGAARITDLSALSLGGLLTISPLRDVFASGQKWNLFSATTVSGRVASFNRPYTSSGWVWATSPLATNGNLTLTTFVPVPEPSTYLLRGSGLACVVALRRRRR